MTTLRSDRSVLITFSNGESVRYDIPITVNAMEDKVIKQWAVEKAMKMVKLIWQVEIVDRVPDHDMAAVIEIPTVEFVNEDTPN